jgi:hypothetical protein
MAVAHFHVGTVPDEVGNLFGGGAQPGPVVTVHAHVGVELRETADATVQARQQGFGIHVAAAASSHEAGEARP